MPSGKKHALATCIAAGMLSPFIYLSGQPAAHTLAFTAGCMAGLVISPDLDVRHRDTHAETIMRRSLGCLGGGIWNLLWLPYAYLIPHHRHPLSHWPILGTAVRLLYLFALPLIVYWLVAPRLGWTPADLFWQPVLWWAVGGLALVDALHWLMDRLL